MKIKDMLPLSREQFKTEVFKIYFGKCIFCGEKAVDAHHILDRSLFKSGGYYLHNGVPVCEKHHWDCEKDVYLPEEIRKIAKIEEIVLPSGFDPHRLYDKFGKDLGPVPYDRTSIRRTTILF